MARQINRQQLIELIEQLEANLEQLKRDLAANPAAKRRPVKKKPKSLYGTWPRADTTLADFREARQSWSRDLGKF